MAVDEKFSKEELKTRRGIQQFFFLNDLKMKFTKTLYGAL